ncbi:MAG TPA: polysaccharide deacetylase family protein [Gaiellaceae bacterium]|nr:polysaccharide deacetylase family protein [Gaiellaceae bacterium]
MLTIVMYHYVRDGARVHARTTADFEAELDHVAERYTCVRLADVVDGEWPDDACVLTFDDGLVEHLATVAPALERRGLTGVFCPPGRAVVERVPLDVQKTQFLLAASHDHAALRDRILEHAALPDPPPHRFDPPETVFVKRALQEGLPDPLRSELLDELFRELVATDDRAFADELYLTIGQCRELVRRGHEVIGHGWEHKRLGLLDEDAQREDLARTRAFVEEVGGTWALCYPYGSRDEATIRLLGESGCAAALTTDPRRATREDALLELPRIDTNDLQREVVELARTDRPLTEQA